MPQARYGAIWVPPRLNPCVVNGALEHPLVNVLGVLHPVPLLDNLPQEVVPLGNGV